MQKVIVYDVGAYSVEVECPRCGAKGEILIPEKKIDERAFVRCPNCGLIYSDSYFKKV